MRKITLFIFLFITQSALATTFKISRINVNYQNNKGKVATDGVTLQGAGIEFQSKDYQIDLAKEENNFAITSNDFDVKLDLTQERFKVLNQLKYLQVRGMDIKLAQKLQTTASYANAMFTGDEIGLQGLFLECDIFKEKILYSCLEKSFLSINVLTVPDSAKAKFEMLATRDLKELNITTNQNKFVGNAKVTLLFDVPVGFSGQVQVDEENKKVIIQNLKVTGGPFPVTLLIIEAIKRAKIPGVEIVGDEIHISLSGAR